MIKGDKMNLGYKKSDLDFNFTDHTVTIEKGISFYLSTDGFWDQMGKHETSRFGQRSFGRKRFADLLKKIASLPFEQQEAKILEAFEAYKGDMRIQDDVTMVGFGFF